MGYPHDYGNPHFWSQRLWFHPHLCSLWIALKEMAKITKLHKGAPAGLVLVVWGNIVLQMASDKLLRPQQKQLQRQSQKVFGGVGIVNQHSWAGKPTIDVGMASHLYP